LPAKKGRHPVTHFLNDSDIELFLTGASLKVDDATAKELKQSTNREISHLKGAQRLRREALPHKKIAGCAILNKLLLQRKEHERDLIPTWLLNWSKSLKILANISVVLSLVGSGTR
jgi:hypothetical protein